MRTQVKFQTLSGNDDLYMMKISICPLPDLTFTFDSWRVWTSSSLSSIFPSEVKRSLRMRSSIAFSWLRSALMRIINSFLCCSRCGLSSCTTSLRERKRGKNVGERKWIKPKYHRLKIVWDYVKCKVQTVRCCIEGCTCGPGGLERMQCLFSVSMYVCT